MAVRRALQYLHTPVNSSSCRGVVVAVWVLAGCSHLGPSLTVELDSAAQQAQKPNATARQLALAGFHELLVTGDMKLAQARLDAALLANSAEPYALWGELLLARRAGHPEKALGVALDLCERAPAHPLASAAARYVLDLSGTAVPLDDLILARGAKAISAGMGGDAGHLLRSALANIYGQRSDGPAQARTLSAMGVPDRYTLVGPFSPFHVLGFDELTVPEKTGSFAGKLAGPYGDLKPRTLAFYDGRFNLSGESTDGDVYLVGVDIDAPAGGDYCVRLVTSVSHKAYLDGEPLFESRTFERTASTVHEQGVKLPAGKHRLVIKLIKEEHSATLSVSILRLDGQPSGLTFSAALGPPPAWGGIATFEPVGTYATTQAFADKLRSETGDALAEFIAIRDGMGRDRDGAKRLMAHLETALHGAALSSLRAELDLGDRSVPHKVARGRATRDLEASADKDPRDVSALLERATVALDDGRLLDAAELVKQARAAQGSVGYLIPLTEARIQLALGIDAQAEQSAIAALKIQPGLCEAQTLRYDLARRRDAGALADGLVKEMEPCPGHFSRSAEHARIRGDLARASKTYEQLLDRDPSQVQTVMTLSNLYVSQKRYDEAVKLLRKQWELWPRNSQLVKRLADVTELWGKPEVALKLREEALQLEGGDLQLRRSVARAQTGKELLAEYAIDGKTAIASYEAQRGTEDSAVSFILDAAAIRAYPDGSMVDRIHIIQKANDPSGTSEIGEVTLPAGAQVLTLRTYKADGKVLEPESIEGKDTVSLPGVQVGDYVEYEYLLAHPPRGPAQPGFTASSFYYQIPRMPNNWSTYTVVAPKGSGMTVDAHNVKAEPTRTQGDLEVFFHEERRVPPYIPEPDSPPSANEYLPFVSVGAGARGNEGLISAFADAFLDRGQLTFEVEQFAHAAAGNKKGLEAAKAIHAAVMKRISGRDSGLTASASASLAQDRGSRLWLLKASLEAVGIKTRLASIRTFGTDPASYAFPTDSLVPYICLRAEVPGAGTVWLDPLIRFGPFAELPEQADGEREAWLLPEPGRPRERVKSPKGSTRLGKQVRLNLKLGADGKLTGEGQETYNGVEAAQLADALDSLSPDQRNQALQSALSRYFGGAELSGLKLDIKQEVGAPLLVSYQFTAPRFARVEGTSMVLGALTFPAHLGRRFVQVGSRRTALFIEETERSHTVVDVELPPGYAVNGPVPELNTGGKFGAFHRTEKQQKNHFLVDETYRLNIARIPPAQYDDFAQFAGEVDLIQSRDLLIQKP